MVRHGETDGNVALRHQHQDTTLNEVGRKQIEEIADEILRFKPTHIICSTNLRAVQTAKIIAERCGLIPETDPNFEEIRRPHWMIGGRYVSLVTAWYVWRWFFNLRIKGEGENYADFLKRIIEARRHLEGLPDDSRVVVVSHAVFINIFIEHLCNDKQMKIGRAVKRFMKILTMKNACVIHLRHRHRQNQCSWEVL